MSDTVAEVATAVEAEVEPAGVADKLPEDRFSNRELSWLNWNARVLTLAEDRRQPLLERMKFLAIMRVEHADSQEFERVFAEAVRRLAALRQRDHVRWYELLSIVFGYSLFRRPAGQHQRLSEVCHGDDARAEDAQRHQRVARGHLARDEGRHGQRERPSRPAHPGGEQRPAGRDHPGNQRNRRRGERAR